MMRVALQGIGLYAPGLPDWQAAIPLLRGEQDWLAAPAPAVTLPLPSAERRRTSACARAAWAAAEQALAAAGRDAREVNTVFCSSGGDGAILHQLCTALASPERAVSPTQFHNSVHNAPAGYFSIAHASHAASTSLCHHAAPFAAGLLEAAVQVSTEDSAVLLVGFDLVAPFPLAPLWPAQQDFAVALLLAPAGREPALAQWRIALSTEAPAAHAESASWIARFVRDNPLAQSLHPLSALASGKPVRHRFPYLDTLSLELESVE
ncbi:MAG: beta-ketoacyl synthase chain length factor [Gammaproteobacteria bacterium]